MAGSLVHTRAGARRLRGAALRTPGPGVRNFVGGAMDSNSFPRPTHNVRRPRKHCVSDTPHAHRAALRRVVLLLVVVPRRARVCARRDSAVQQSAPYCSSGVTLPPRAGAPASRAGAPASRARHRHRRLGYTASRASLPALGPPTAAAAVGGPRRGVSRRGERHRRRRRARTSYRHTQG